MALKSTAINRREYYGLDVDEATGQHYISFMESLPRVDRMAFYKIDAATYDRYLADLDSALPFVNECRNGQHDDLRDRRFS